LKNGDDLELPKCLDDMPCAAGTKCVIAVKGVPALAKYIHRCPGMTQDFWSCNKFIHAVCGVEIPENIKRCEMHSRWCFTCYEYSGMRASDTPIAVSVPTTTAIPDLLYVPITKGITGVQTVSKLSTDTVTKAVQNNESFPLFVIPPVTRNPSKFDHTANPYKKFEIPKKLSGDSLKLRTRFPIAMTSKPEIKSIKQYQLFVTVPVPQAQTSPDEHFRFAIFINAFASMMQDKSVFEFKPELFTKMCDLLYSLKGSECELPVGSMNNYTDMILSAFSDIHKVRAVPGSQDNVHKMCSVKGDYMSFQLGGLFEVKIIRPDLITQELGALVQEFRNIVSSRNFLHAYKLAAYWQYCMEGDTGVTELMNTFNDQARKVGNNEQVFTRANAKGGVYHLIIADRYNILSTVLGLTAPDVKFDVAFDKILLDQEIARYTEAIVGVYSAAYEHVLFCRKIVDRDVSFLQDHTITRNLTNIIIYFNPNS